MGVGAVIESGVNERPRYLNLVRILENAIIQVDVTAPPGIVESGAIIRESGSFNGDCGGSCSYVIDIDDDTGEFTGSLTFNSYCSEDVTVSGSASFSGTYDDVNDRFAEFSLSMTSLTMSSDGDSFTTSGSISYDYANFPAFVGAHMDMLIRDNSTGKVYHAHNYYLELSEGPGYVDFYVFGRFYDPDYGYVDVDTTTDFRILDGDICPSQGVLVLVGNTGIAGGSTRARLRIVPIIAYEVDADTNGDGTYDWNSGQFSCL